MKEFTVKHLEGILQAEKLLNDASVYFRTEAAKQAMNSDVTIMAESSQLFKAAASARASRGVIQAVLCYTDVPHESESE
ncbi:MAG: hypothetical protein GY841_18525 [FCB group bacterium]|nr:hypothetical protein [FCB group bacterium]